MPSVDSSCLVFRLFRIWWKSGGAAATADGTKGGAGESSLRTWFSAGVSWLRISRHISAYEFFRRFRSWKLQYMLRKRHLYRCEEENAGIPRKKFCLFLQRCIICRYSGRASVLNLGKSSLRMSVLSGQGRCGNKRYLHVIYGFVVRDVFVCDWIMILFDTLFCVFFHVLFSSKDF
ncbi:unnamed protein product [Ectocarpus sp. 13 AM-2016]